MLFFNILKHLLTFSEIIYFSYNNCKYSTFVKNKYYSQIIVVTSPGNRLLYYLQKDHQKSHSNYLPLLDGCLNPCTSTLFIQSIIFSSVLENKVQSCRIFCVNKLLKQKVKFKQCTQDAAAKLCLQQFYAHIPNICQDGINTSSTDTCFSWKT